MAMMSFFYFNVIFMSLATLATDAIQPKKYPVKKIAADVQLTGEGADPQWQQAEILSDFVYPWENETPPSTNFRALHNEAWVYCLFDVTDHQVNIRRETDDKWEVAASTRAEIFLRIDDKLSPYYCLEIDPLARVLDYEGHHYRKFNGKWSWPKDGLIVKSHLRSDGYTIEIAISKASLLQLNLLRDNQLQAGLFRADCLPTKEGRPDFKWASWVRPDADTPDFHIPSAFGILELL